MNYLCIFADQDAPPAQIRNGLVEQRTEKPFFVLYKDPSMGQWRGPAEVRFVGRGYMCVLAPTGPQWIPSQWTKAAVVASNTHAATDKSDNINPPED